MRDNKYFKNTDSVNLFTTTSLASIAMPLLGAVPNGTATNKSGPIILFSQKSCLPDDNKC
jgi:hypothetical protein